MEEYTTKFKPDVIVRGPMLPEPVKIEVVQEVGDTVRLIGEGLQTGKFYKPLLTLEQLDLLEIVTEASYDGDPVKFRLGIEAMRYDSASPSFEVVVPFVYIRVTSKHIPVSYY